MTFQDQTNRLIRVPPAINIRTREICLNQVYSLGPVLEVYEKQLTTLDLFIRQTRRQQEQEEIVVIPIHQTKKIRILEVVNRPHLIG